MLLSPILPALYPTPLIEGFPEQIPEQPDSPQNPFLAGTFTLQPTPLLDGFARQPRGLDDRRFSGTLTLHPTPLLGGFDTGRTVIRDYQDADGTPVTTTTFGDQFSLVATNASIANKTFLVMCTAMLNISTGGQTGRIRLNHDTAASVLMEFRGENGGSSERTPVTLMGIVSFGAAPGNQTFSIETANVTSNYAIKSNYNRIMMIELISGVDHWVADASQVQNADTTNYTTLGTVTIPAGISNADFDIFAGTNFMELASSTNGQDYAIYDTDGTTQLRYMNGKSLVSTTRIQAHAFHATKTGLNAGQTLTFKAKRDGGSGTKNFTNRVLVALNRSRWQAAATVNDPTSRTAAGTTFAARNAASTLTATLQAGTYICFGNGTQQLQTGDNKPHLQLVADGTVIAEAYNSGGNISGGNRGFITWKQMTIPAGSRTIEWQTKTDAGSSGVPTFDFADVGYWKVA